MESVEELIKKYDRYIIVLATKFNINDLKEDLIQEGKIAIFNSYYNYNEDKGTLHSYLVTSIRNAMITYINTYGSTIRRPKQLVKEHININFISTSTPLGNDTDTTVGDTIPIIEEDTSIDDQETAQRAAVMHYLDKLKESHQQIIKMHIIEEMTFEDISKELGVSRQAISQKYKIAINKLKMFYLKNNN
jgi:RNA polymerase sigma factor (sigma-70 family)